MKCLRFDIPMLWYMVYLRAQNSHILLQARNIMFSNLGDETSTTASRRTRCSLLTKNSFHGSPLISLCGQTKQVGKTAERFRHLLYVHAAMRTQFHVVGKSWSPGVGWPMPGYCYSSSFAFLATRSCTGGKPRALKIGTVTSSIEPWLWHRYTRDRLRQKNTIGTWKMSGSCTECCQEHASQEKNKSPDLFSENYDYSMKTTTCAQPKLCNATRSRLTMCIWMWPTLLWKQMFFLSIV